MCSSDALMGLVGGAGGFIPIMMATGFTFQQTLLFSPLPLVPWGSCTRVPSLTPHPASPLAGLVCACVCACVCVCAWAQRSLGTPDRCASRTHAEILFLGKSLPSFTAILSKPL